MCGIAGYKLSNHKSDAHVLPNMLRKISHRGPDDEGYFFASSIHDVKNGFVSKRSCASILAGATNIIEEVGVPSHDIGLAQNRFSIVDLSAAGHQPMISECGNIALTFNGEVYNFIELRSQLESLGVSFESRSDTEVLLKGYCYWGEKVFDRVNGFFAVAIYDHRRRDVLLARDPLGKAHLYLSRKADGATFWASEIKALTCAGFATEQQINDTAVHDYIFYNRKDHNGTFYKDVLDFPPGHFCWMSTYSDDGPVRYWNIPDVRLTTSDISFDEASSQFKALLLDAISIRLRADVPISFELSGGMDSSSIVGLAAGELGLKFSTETVKFKERHSDEEPFARLVANRYPDQIEYNVTEPDSNSFWANADSFINLLEEPFHAPNLQTNQTIRRNFKERGSDVVITGAAGDEVLCGYAGDYLNPFLRELLSRGALRSFVREITGNTEIPLHRNVIRLVADLVLDEVSKTKLRQTISGERALLRKIGSERLIAVAHGLGNFPSLKSAQGITNANLTHRLMNYWLRSGYKSDYGIPIESRAPFLDRRIVNFATQLPQEYLIQNGWHKFILRKVAEPYLPKEVTWRQNKMGFPFPYAEWLQESKELIYANLHDQEIPYYCTRQLFMNYDLLRAANPVTLWRLVSLGLWWRRVIKRQEIVSN